MERRKEHDYHVNEKNELHITTSFFSFILQVIIFSSFFLTSCTRTTQHKEIIDHLNELSYYYHYKNIDSTAAFARQAFMLSDNYNGGKAEALNNLAFVNIARMNYAEASSQLDSILSITNNQVELLIANIQQMRLCQRESRNKDFYEYQEKAVRALSRINEDRDMLDEHQQKRMVYAESEFAVVKSTYYYYMGLETQSQQSIEEVNLDAITKDTAQYLNYLYQYGAGGIIHEGTRQEILQKEWDYLFRCYVESQHSGDVFWEANALQGLSEHLFVKSDRQRIIADNPISITAINPDNMADSLLAGYLAEKSLNLFLEYNDVYQIAGAYRTLSQCYWIIGDFKSSIFCLDKSLENKAIHQAPDLVASIRERLSLTYSALDDKQQSDLNRNIFLDMQEITRQDRQLEARVMLIEKSSRQLTVMIIAVILMIFIVVISLYIFDHLRRMKEKKENLSSLMEPMKQWQRNNNQEINILNEKIEEIKEEYSVNLSLYQNNKKRYSENRAKMFLVNSVTPFIDRIIHEVKCLKNKQESNEIVEERLAYLSELTEKINEYNQVLTEWIQLRQGNLNLKIESFKLQDLFDIVSKSSMSFQLKGIELNVVPTEDVVKADKIMTLFMINTIADNARKYTDQGGKVTISSSATTDYVEISVTDTGKGLEEEQLKTIFNKKVTNGHGFGLMNCKGIIEKYKKVSQLFANCMLGAESKPGKGSRFFFRLPHGVRHSILLLLMTLSLTANASTTQAGHYKEKAQALADSIYICNILGDYEKAIAFADSTCSALNSYCKMAYPDNNNFLTMYEGNNAVPAEIEWFHQNMDIDYDVILTFRNECAVAALAVHNWSLYHYNNQVYIQLYKEKSADNSLEEYVKSMEKVEVNKKIAVAILIILLIIILSSYYFLYYRHQLYYRFCVEQIEHINNMLLSDINEEKKLSVLNEMTYSDASKWPNRLYQIVNKIKEALTNSIAARNNQYVDMEQAEDDLHRIEYENQKLYVNNNVLDNCLSTLKHETMYYPSKIHQLVEEPMPNIDVIDEVVSFYKEMYSILSEQAMRQLEKTNADCKPMSLAGIRVDADALLIEYLLEILKKEAKVKTLSIEPEIKNEQYVLFRIPIETLRRTDLFTPQIKNIPYMICRQIVRDISETTNKRGCGIVAEKNENDTVTLCITLGRSHNTHVINNNII